MEPPKGQTRLWSRHQCLNQGKTSRQGIIKSRCGCTRAGRESIKARRLAKTTPPRYSVHADSAGKQAWLRACVLQSADPEQGRSLGHVTGVVVSCPLLLVLPWFEPPVIKGRERREPSCLVPGDPCHPCLAPRRRTEPSGWQRPAGSLPAAISLFVVCSRLVSLQLTCLSRSRVLLQ